MRGNLKYSGVYAEDRILDRPPATMGANSSKVTAQDKSVPLGPLETLPPFPRFPGTNSFFPELSSTSRSSATSSTSTNAAYQP